MPQPLRQATILLAALWVVSSGQASGQVPSVVHGPDPTAMDFRSVGEWTVSPAGQMVVVTLECVAFANQADNSAVANTTLRLTPQSVSGGASGSVLVSQDSTDLANNQPVARVSAAVNGSGMASFQLEASIDSSELHAAGSYETTVAATLSAP